MQGLEDRVLLAQGDPRELERLLTDYLPFLKAQIARAGGGDLEYDDKLSLAMITFVNCARQYETGRGGFLGFCIASIRNRLIDEGRRAARRGNVLPLFPQGEDGGSLDGDASLTFYEKERERQALAEEIQAFSGQLEGYGITLAQLADVSPRWQSAREQCVNAAWVLTQDPEMKRVLLDNRRVAQTELARRVSLSPKTIEKHRKYIVAAALLFLGDYPGIRSFLPLPKEVR